MPNDPAKDSPNAAVSAARNEAEAFQVIVSGGENGLSQVNATAGDLVGPNGRTIPGDQVILFRQHYVRVTIPSFLCGVTGNPRKTGEYPDPLIPFFDPYKPGQHPLGAPFDVAPGRNQPIYVEVKVPEDCQAGTYKGHLTVTAQGDAPVEVPITLTVWDFSIPRERSVSTAYGLSWNNILSYHGGPDGAWDADSLIILKHYEDELHRHRLDATNIAQDVGNPFRFDESGDLLPVDWSAYDAAIGPRIDGSYFSDGVGARRFNTGFFRPGNTGGMEGNLSEDQYKAASAEFATHLKEKGWMDHAYVYVSDEPFLNPEEYARIVLHVKLMKEADPDWDRHFLVTNWYWKGLDGSIGIWCPDTSKYDSWFLGFLGINFPGRDVYPSRFEKGEELWFYVCNCTFPPYAGYDIDTTKAYEPRILMWGAWFEGASGFLYWRTNYWQTEDPWGTVIDPVSFPLVARNGDGFLMYPGDHNGTAAPAGSPEGIAIDGPIPSLRLKATRDGLEDWEMFLIACTVAGKDAVRSAVSRAYTKPGSFPLSPVYNPTDPPWTYSEEVVRQVREEVARLIEPPRSLEHSDSSSCGCFTTGMSARFSPIHEVLLLLGGPIVLILFSKRLLRKLPKNLETDE